jgi:hypothetical protein
MHYNAKQRVVGKLARPADDLLFGIVIEVAFVEWRGIERIEELCKLANSNFNSRVLLCPRLPRMFWRQSISPLNISAEDRPTFCGCNARSFERGFPTSYSAQHQFQASFKKGNS